MKTLIAILAVCFGLECRAQRISALTTTNVVVGTNTLAMVMHPNTTNGTRQVTVDNLFSNRVTYVTATNLTSILSGRYTNDVSGFKDTFVLFTALQASSSLQRTNMLPSAVAGGREITVCDGSKTATGSNIWIATVSSQTINGGPTVTNINLDNACATFISDGTGWRVKCVFP